MALVDACRVEEDVTIDSRKTKAFDSYTRPDQGADLVELLTDHALN